uniref:Alpha-(1,6)-fucosyltransferase N- and catalytic domain-containing protein n=1 Tax=Ditylenchus dipsaci TaxID=166011 RepID=A0A915ET78_9BILA
MPASGLISSRLQQTALMLNITLFQHHSNPSAFFTAQFTWYLWKLNESLRKNIEEIEEHIKWAEYWFRVKEIQLNKLVQRRIFIATDDLAVINETKTKYPNYDIHGDEQLSKIKDLKTNDIKELLENSECLTAYSLMQISKGDMDDHYVSLDYIEKFRIKIQDHVLLANDSNNSFSINENYNTTTKVHSPIDSSEGYNNQTINSTEFSSSFMAKEKHEIVEFPPFEKNIM